MDEGESASEKDAAETDQLDKVRLLRAESLERHRAVTWLNRACPEPTFTRVLKCVFLILVLSVFSTFFLGGLLSNSPWNIPAPIVTDWKVNILIVAFVAVIYLGAFLRELRRTSGSASQRTEEVPTISASIQQV